MGFKSRNIFGAQLNRNFKAGSKIADNVTKGLLLGGLVGADYIYRKSQRPRSQYRPLTTRELQEIEVYKCYYWSIDCIAICARFSYFRRISILL